MFYFDLYVVSAYLRIVYVQYAAAPTAQDYTVRVSQDCDANLIELSVTLRADQRSYSVCSLITASPTDKSLLKVLESRSNYTRNAGYFLVQACQIGHYEAVL